MDPKKLENNKHTNYLVFCGFKLIISWRSAIGSIPLTHKNIPRVAPAWLERHIKCNMPDFQFCCMRRISTKRKKEIYNLSSLLLHLIVFIGLLLSLGTDEKETPQGKQAKPAQEAASPLEGLFANLKR